MCCLTTILLLLGPRLAILVWWFMNSAIFNLAFGKWPHPFHLAFPLWVWPLVGAIFVPWTTLAYLIVLHFRGHVVGLDWLWLGLGLLVDIGSHGGGGYRHRKRIPGCGS